MQVLACEPKGLLQILFESEYVFTSYSNFCKVCKMTCKEEKRIKRIFLQNLLTRISEWLEGFHSNLECDLFYVEASSTVNLVPFG